MVETIESGWNVLVGTDREALAAALADPPRGARHPPSTAGATPAGASEPPWARSWRGSRSAKGRRGAPSKHYIRASVQATKTSGMSIPYLEIEARGSHREIGRQIGERRAS